MHGALGRRLRTTVVIVLVGSAFAAANALAASDRPSALLVFPKVIADGTHDTIIQIVNASSTGITARCAYWNAASSPAGQATPFGLPFSVDGTPPTPPPTPSRGPRPLSWVVSQGHISIGGNPQINPCCGEVPAVAPPFRGALWCVVTDSTGHPVANADKLVGTATIKDLVSGDTSKYSAVGLSAMAANDGNEVLCLGGTGSSICPAGTEYQACPRQWVLDHLAYNAADPVIGGGSAVRTNIAILSCSQDFSSSAPPSVTIDFDLHDGLAQPSVSIAGWADLPLNAVSAQFNASPGKTYMQTTLTPAGADPGILMVAEEFHDSGGASPVTSSAALNPQTTGVHSLPDTIVLPPRCPSDAQCGAGTYCSQVGVCVPKRALGVVCAADPIDASGAHQCVSAHCTAGVCKSS